MRKDNTYQLLIAKMEEVSMLPPQEMGKFTYLYRSVVPYFKFSPWKSILIVSGLLTFSFYLLLGSTLVRLASLLQFGF